MKTIEEMKKAVLAYCEEVCKERMQCYGIGIGLKMSKSSSQYVIEQQDDRGGWWILATINKYTEPSDSLILTFYRLLGLETRDAVAAEKARFFKEIDSCTLSLGKMAIRAKVAEARNTALVTLLTTMKENADQDDSDDATFRQWVFDAASYRLTANEKGVNHER